MSEMTKEERAAHHEAIAKALWDEVPPLRPTATQSWMVPLPRSDKAVVGLLFFAAALLLVVAVIVWRRAA